MKLDENFDPIETDPAVPDKLLERCLKYLHQVVRVDVERKRGKNSWNKINGYAVSRNAKGECEASGEEVAAMIIMIAQADQDERGTNETYRAKFHIETKGGKLDRKVFAFSINAEDGEATATLDNVEEKEALVVAFDRVIALVDTLKTHIEAQNTQILESSRSNSSQIGPLLATIETLVEKYHEGLSMQANALQTLFDVERGMKAEEFKAQRDQALIGMLTAAVPRAFDQFGAYLRKKFSLGDTPQEAEGAAQKPEATPGKPAPAGPASQAPPGQPTAEPAASEPKMTEEEERAMKEKPLTVFAHAFREGITSEQWIKLSQALSKPQLKKFSDALTAETDDATAEGILQFRKSMPTTRMLSLAQILSEEQMQMIMELLKLIEQYEPKEPE